MENAVIHWELKIICELVKLYFKICFLDVIEGQRNRCRAKCVSIDVSRFCGEEELKFYWRIFIKAFSVEFNKTAVEIHLKNELNDLKLYKKNIDDLKLTILSCDFDVQELIGKVSVVSPTDQMDMLGRLFVLSIFMRVVHYHNFKCTNNTTIKNEIMERLFFILYDSYLEDVEKLQYRKFKTEFFTLKKHACFDKTINTPRKVIEFILCREMISSEYNSLFDELVELTNERFSRTKLLENNIGELKRIPAVLYIIQIILNGTGRGNGSAENVVFSYQSTDIESDVESIFYQMFKFSKWLNKL